MKSICLAYPVSSSAYDQRLGQFLSADPFVQDPTNTQNYNRYAYCLNNPLKYTDPSGYRATNGNNNYLNDNDPSKISASFEISNVRIWGQQLDNFRTYMTNYKNNEVLVGVTESVFSESDGTYIAFSSGFYIAKYDGKLVFTTNNSDLQNLSTKYNDMNGQYYNTALMDIGDHSNDYSNCELGYSANNYFGNTSDVANALGNSINVSVCSIEGFAAVNRGNNIINVSNGSVSIIRTYGASGFKYVKIFRSLGVIGSVVTTGFSANTVADQYNKGGLNEVAQHRDVVDLTVGAVGLGATALATFGIISNPVGWCIGIGVGLYGLGTLVYDIYDKK